MKTEQLTDIGPECFTNGEVVSFKGENYYKACDWLVAELPGGGQSFCVKRVGHPGLVHEDYDGRTRGDEWEYGLVNDETSAFVITAERARFYRSLGEPVCRRRLAGKWEPIPEDAAQQSVQ